MGHRPRKIFSPKNLSGFHENNEELQAAMLNKGLEEGRSLLNNPQHTNSLAAEFEAMSENEVGMNTFDLFCFETGRTFSILL